MLQASAGVVVCVSKNSHSRFLRHFFGAFCITLQQVSEGKKLAVGTNRNVPARNTLVQLLALDTNPESHNTQLYREMDDLTLPVGRMPAVRQTPSAEATAWSQCAIQTDDTMMPIADPTV